MEYEDICKTVGNNIHDLRKRFGLSKRKLADALKCDPSSIRHWDDGDFLPSSVYLPMLSEIFYCSIDYLFGRD